MKEKLKKLDNVRWELDASARERMNVKARIIGSKEIIDRLEDTAIEQLTNVACLPGVVEPVLAMPDAHWGYGLPMGAVGAFDAEEGVISAGCTGFDINCGIHMIRSDLTVPEIQDTMPKLMDALFRKVPAGVGSQGPLRLSHSDMDEVLTRGAQWAVDKGYGVPDDLDRMEENGCIEGASCGDEVSSKARQRGSPQLGSLGSGNHFLEIQRIDQIYEPEVAETFGITNPDQVVIMLHCGSRGFGHQVASDYLDIHSRAAKKYNIWLPDKQLVCAPVKSDEGQAYFLAMKAAVNYAFTNRLVMTHWIREAFESVFDNDWQALGLNTIYDVCHNICKLETHQHQGEKRQLYVHRKGATRSFGPGQREVPDVYRAVGQPVLIAGSMGTASYVLAGTEKAMMESFGSSCHGAGRAMSRTRALKQFWGATVRKELEAEGRHIRSTNPSILAEEAPGAYKDIDLVIESVHLAGISRKVARTMPLGVVKGGGEGGRRGGKRKGRQGGRGQRQRQGQRRY